MADERYDWLDVGAAENLLRGEPLGDHAGAGLPRLEAALRAVRTPGPSGAELPGEAVAVAAFREAYGSGKRTAAAQRAEAAGPPAPLWTVRIGAAPPASPRRSRRSLPVRFGLALSLAGCALGGVAFAGGRGVLPMPFGSHGAPLPAASVSAAASPAEKGAGVPDPEGFPPLPSWTSEEPGSPAPSDGTPDGQTHRKPPAGPGGDDAAPEDGDQDTGPGGGTRDGRDGGDEPRGSEGRRAAKSVRACRQYRDGLLSEEQERRLLELAGDKENLDRFCDRLLRSDGGGGPNGGRTNGGRVNSGGKAGGGPGHGKDDGRGALPPATFHPPDAPGRGTHPWASAFAGPALSVRR